MIGVLVLTGCAAVLWILESSTSTSGCAKRGGCQQPRFYLAGIAWILSCFVDRISMLHE